jgi:hypothetical protein
MMPLLPRAIYPLVSTNKLSKHIGVKKVDLIALASVAGRYYEPFDRYKGHGSEWRHIDNPVGNLKHVQKSISKYLLRPVIISLPDGMVGGIAGKSIEDNAKYHVHKEVVVRIDIRDCFPSISERHIARIWASNLGCGRNVVNILTKLTSFQGRLPQGASTSSALCNLALLPLFQDIDKYCRSYDLSVSMFVDDITFSGKAVDVYKSIGPVIKIVQRHGFSIRHKKINIMPANRKQKSVGLVLNRKISIERKRVEEVRKKIVQLAKKSNISRADLYSISGSIKSIKRISHHHGDKLESFANMLLPKDIIEIKSKSKTKTRKCYSTKWHE